MLNQISSSGGFPRDSSMQPFVYNVWKSQKNLFADEGELIMLRRTLVG